MIAPLHRQGGVREIARFLARQRASVAHGAEHPVTARQRAVGRLARRVGRRRLDQPRERRGLDRCQLLCGRAEVAARRRLDAVIAIAEIHAIQIGLENCRFTKPSFDRDGEQHLPHLAAERSLSAQRIQPYQLLRDAAAAFDEPPGAQIGPRRAHHAHDVDAVMVIEAPIFNGEDRRHHVRGHAVQRYVRPILAEEREDRPVVHVEDDRRL